MIPSLTREQIKNVFAKDNNGRYLNLVIPYIEDDCPEISLKGKKDDELSLEEIIRLKQYAGMLAENRSDKNKG